MGADHATQLSTTVPNAVTSAVADVDWNRAVDVGASVRARSFHDAYELIDDAAVDAVVIASRDSTHADLVRACVAARKPVLCEKPLAPSLADATSLLADVGASGERLISVGFMRRFDPGYARLKSITDARRYGPPLVVHCVSRGVTSGAGTTSESSVTGSSIHDLDVVPWLLNSPIVEVAWIAPRPSSRATGLQDPQVLLLRTRDGVLTTVETYLNASYGYDIRCEVVCETGVASIAEPTPVVIDSALARRVGYWADWRPRFADAYRLELSAWVQSVVSGAGPVAPMATAHDALVAAAVAQAVIDSMHADGRFVAVRATSIAAAT